GLETGSRAGVPALSRDDLAELQQGLQPERTRHDRVLVEVGGEEPLVRADLLDAFDEPQPRRPTVRLETAHPVEHAQHWGGERGGARILERLRSVALLDGGLVRSGVADADLLRQGP